MQDPYAKAIILIVVIVIILKDKSKPLNGVKEIKALEVFLWQMEQY